MTNNEMLQEKLLNHWSAAQEQMLEAWTTWMKEMGSATNVTKMVDAIPIPGEGEALDASSYDRLFHQFTSATSALQGLLDLSANTWDLLSRQNNEDLNWVELTRQLCDKWIEKSFSLSGLQSLAEFDKSKLWKTFKAQVHESLMIPPGMVNPGFGGSGGVADPSLLSKLQKSWNVIPSIAGELAELPHVGAIDTKFQKQLLRGFNAWAALLDAHGRHEQFRLQAYQDVVSLALKRLATNASAGEQITSSREWLLFWVDAGDEVLMQMYRSDDYLIVQRELIGAIMEYRKWLQSANNSLLKQYGVPTSEDLTDAYQSIQSLRREVRSLKRQIKSLEEKHVEPAARAAKRRSSK